MNDEYPDIWKPVAERRPEPVTVRDSLTESGEIPHFSERHHWSTTGAGNRFPLVVQPGPGYPESWGYAATEVVLDGVVEALDQDGD
ncbi:hypothetical protein QEN35_20935 [Gordonia alkanivorans]|uniref:hypothetical protein n=1 Tax=Gordonia alkanivorans TaxID=84096 RepID=UPI001F4E2C49|nr:hypothetical protein [Gordonia alkanivorans]MDH3026825.1 hypothetical protein [Gordonia alkanivorans]